MLRPFEDPLDHGDPALAQVEHLVAEHLSEEVAEDDVGAERWWCRRGCCQPLLVPAEGWGGLVDPRQLFEPGLSQEGAHLLGGAQVAECWVPRPRDREVDGRDGSG